MERWEPEDDPEPESAVGHAVRMNDTRVNETLLRGAPSGDACEQYTEQGRIHGMLVPEFLRQDLVSTARPDSSGSTPSDALNPASRWASLTRRFDKRALVPPGDCFIELTARASAEVRVVG